MNISATPTTGILLEQAPRHHSTTTEVEQKPAASAPERVPQTKEADSTHNNQQQLAEIKQLKARDQEVRAHEAAHAAAGGRYTGGASFTFQRGPDGVMYAVGGEVSISSTPVANDPQATLEKA